MSTILDRLEEECSTHRRHYPWNSPITLEIKEEPTGKIEPRGFATQEEYVIQARLAVTYWANTAQRADNRQVARRCLVRTLYGDILSRLHRLQLAVSNGDRDEAMSLLGEITSIVEGP